MRIKTWLKIGVFFAFAVALAIAIPILLPPTPGITYANYSRIEHGMTREQVQLLLGEPMFIRDETHWFWTRDGNIVRIMIRFDERGLVTTITWNGVDDERTAFDKVRDRLPWIAREPPGPMHTFFKP